MVSIYLVPKGIVHRLYVPLESSQLGSKIIPIGFTELASIILWDHMGYRGWAIESGMASIALGSGPTWI